MTVLTHGEVESKENICSGGKSNWLELGRVTRSGRDIRVQSGWGVEL